VFKVNFYRYTEEYTEKKGAYVVRLEGPKVSVIGAVKVSVKTKNLRMCPPGKMQAAEPQRYDNIHMYGQSVEPDTQASRLTIPSTVPPQPAEYDVAAQIAQTVREWEAETPDAYHYVFHAESIEADPDRTMHESDYDFRRRRGQPERPNKLFDFSTMHKPQKFVAIFYYFFFC
jgi:hypothetical protein